MEQNKQKYIGVVIIILVVILGAFFVLKGKKANAPAAPVIAPIAGTGVDTGVEIKDTVNAEVSPSIPVTKEKPAEIKPIVDNTPSNLTPEQKDLLAKLQKTVNARDFPAFSSALLDVYKNKWGDVKEFTKAESELYVYATDTYWAKGDLENSLKVSTLVYNKAPEAWRFRYLRIITLEKYGRNALNKEDLKTAESYANQILQMTFRPEGANLLADVYISKIKANIKDGNTALAKQNLDFIWDYEVSQDRRDALTALKKQVAP